MKLPLMSAFLLLQGVSTFFNCQSVGMDLSDGNSTYAETSGENSNVGKSIPLMVRKQEVVKSF